MIIKTYLSALLVMTMCVFSKKMEAQNVPTPEAFLGYALGSKYTMHFKILAYFEAAAQAAPAVMKLEKYGETYEGRPLMMAVVSSAENMARLEDIRKNNLRLTKLLTDRPGDPNAPAIVWLSYNVHGNETSSSEAAMKTLYELISGKNTKAMQWLKNTVVIIDPCLNPDGRDRYVNWFSQVSGTMPDANPASREHREPWPGGRTNHYNFDLNRDWAWQTQKESEARLSAYQKWMPQIHCDFHEQSPGSPYYFAPAAEPIHEAVTQWQRDFQVTVGKNHAAYFDRNGWLYFTKQYFDLFYPSYGDTWPLFNGAIGMTYEQAGGPAGGLAITLETGDTLRLTDRIEHHFTTGMSTIEIASANAAALIGEFKKYFDRAAAGNGNRVKSYVVLPSASGEMAALKQLLKKNAITYSYAGAASSVKGYDYFSGKQGTFTVDKNSIVIPAAQPKGDLLRVLFEQQTKLTDSATYDITAWAVPYAFGLRTISVNDVIATVNEPAAPSAPKPYGNAYGYLAPMHSFGDAEFLSSVLNAGIKVRFAESPFTNNGIASTAGSLIILSAGNEAKLPELYALAAKNAYRLTAISSGFVQAGFDFGSDKLHFIKNPTVALLTGDNASSGAAGEVWHLFEQQLHRQISLLNAEDLRRAELSKFDVLILADGNYSALKSKDAAADIKKWVEAGGRLIMMENAAIQAAGLEWGFKLKKEADGKEDSASKYREVRKFADRERESVVNNVPGAIYRLQLDNTHPVAFGYPDYYYTLKQNPAIFEFLKDGWNIASLRQQKPVSGFVGSKIKEQLKDGTLIGEMPMGKGSVVFFADDPLFRSFWENGKMLFTNAVFYRSY